MKQAVPLRTAFFLCFFLFTYSLLAQPYRSQKGRFEVDYIRGCAPLTVTVIADNDDGSRVIQYGSRQAGSSADPNNFSEAKTLVFPEPGEYELLQLTGASGDDDASLDMIRISVFEAVAPVFTVSNCGNSELLVAIAEDDYDFYTIFLNGSEVGSTATSGPRQFTLDAAGNSTASVRVLGRYSDAPSASCGESQQEVTVWETIPPAQINSLQANVGNGSVQLEFTLNPNVNYLLEVAENGGSYQPVQEISEGSSLSLSGFNFETTYYCFRINPLNACQQATLSTGEPLCSTALQPKALSGENQLNFRTQAQAQQEIRILAEERQLFQSFSEFSGTLSDPVSCGENRCYIAEIQQGSAISQTGPFCLENRLSGTAAAPLNIFTYWENSNAYLSFADPAAAFARRFVLWEENSENQLRQQTDSLLRVPEPEACYRMQYADGCQNLSDLSRPVCPLFLIQLPTDPDVLSLQWNAYEGYEEGVATYQIERIDPSGQSTLFSLGQATTYLESGLTSAANGTRFRLWALPNNDRLPASLSNEIVFELEVSGYFPNAFTPDGDGQNDTFGILGKFVVSGELTIFDRWGRAVFTSSDIFQGWNGLANNGNEAVAGTYVYKATFETADGQQHSAFGSVLLIRN